MIPVFKSNFLNDIAIDLGLQWKRIVKRMGEPEIEKDSDSVGEIMNFWSRSAYCFRADMSVRDDFEVVISLRDELENRAFELRMNTEDSKSIVEAFLDSCHVMNSHYRNNPIPALERMLRLLKPEITEVEQVSGHNSGGCAPSA